VSAVIDRICQESRDMDLVAIALIVGLAVVGLAWIAFADRI
jgi:hypothetical protein